MSKLGVTLDILNQKGTPAFYSDIFTNRPAAGFAGRVFISTDTGAIYEDTGSTWTLIADATGVVTTPSLQSVTTVGKTTNQGISISAGGLSSNSVSIVGGTASQFLKADGTLDSSTYLTTGSAASTYLPLAGGTLTGNLSIPSSQLAIGTATAGAPLDVHTTTGTAAQFNGTTTNNAFVFFQNAGTSKWRIGNLYNAGANSFQIFDVLSGTARLTILNNGSTTLNGAFNGTSGVFSGDLIGVNIKTTSSLNITYLLIENTTINASNRNWAIVTNNTTFGDFSIRQSLLTGGNPVSAGADILYISPSGNTTLNGTFTATSLIKSGGTSAQILAGDGSVITAGTNITISGGTISASGGGMAIGGSITSATAGSVLYAGASGVLAQTNAQFYYDYTNNRLALGTTTPGSKLQVGGSVAIGYTTSTIAPTNGLVISGTTLIGSTTDNGGGFALQVTGSANGASFYSPSGTTQGAVAKFQNTTNNGYLQVQIGGSSSGVGGWSNGFIFEAVPFSTGNFVFSAYSNSFVWQTNARSEKMRLNASGNLLLGSPTDNGQGVLQVTGGITANNISLTGATYSASATLTNNYYNIFTGSTGQTLTLPTPLSNNYQYVIINNTSNTVTLAAATSTNIITTTGTSVASITLIANQRVFVIADGNNKYYQIF